MRKSLLLFVLLTALSAGLLAGACAAVQGRREAVSYRAEILAGDPAAADGVEPVSYTHLTLPTILLV